MKLNVVLLQHWLTQIFMQQALLGSTFKQHSSRKNLIINCDRGISFGMDGRDNIGGIIRNNMIYHAANHGFYGDTGIAFMEIPNTQIHNNSIFMENSFPCAIVYLFTSTSNFTNKLIMARDSAIGKLASNVITAIRSWFVNPSVDDLHLTFRVDGVINIDKKISELINDYDSRLRSCVCASPMGLGPHKRL